MNEIDRIVEANKDSLLTGIDQLLASAALHQNVSIDKLEFGGVEEDSIARVERVRADLFSVAESMTPDITEAMANATEPFPGESDDLYGRVIHYGNSVDFTDFADSEEDDTEDDDPNYLF